MFNLIVMSKNQTLLDQFLKSVFETSDEDKVGVYVLSKDLKLPPNVAHIRMDEFRPNHYFNRAVSTLDFNSLVGIVNDDIVLSEGWYEDIMEKFKISDFVSPGFIETTKPLEFIRAVSNTEEKEGYYEGIFDAFYCFPAKILLEIGKFDDDIIEWYDLDFLISMLNLGYKPITSKKVTVMHLARQTLTDKTEFKDKVKQEILNKYGQKGLNIARSYPAKIRKEFKYS